MFKINEGQVIEFAGKVTLGGKRLDTHKWEVVIEMRVEDGKCKANMLIQRLNKRTGNKMTWSENNIAGISLSQLEELVEQELILVDGEIPQKEKEKLVKVEQVELESETGETTKVESIAEANEQIQEWANKTPTLGYHKVNFGILYADGRLYKGRIDLEQNNVEKANLTRHLTLSGFDLSYYQTT